MCRGVRNPPFLFLFLPLYQTTLFTKTNIPTLLQIMFFKNKHDANLHNSFECNHISYYSLIAFDERVTFWLQRVRSLPCASLSGASPSPLDQSLCLSPLDPSPSPVGQTPSPSPTKVRVSLDLSPDSAWAHESNNRKVLYFNPTFNHFC